MPFLPPTASPSPFDIINQTDQTLKARQELAGIKQGERDKAKGPAYGFEGMTWGEIVEQRRLRLQRMAELQSYLNAMFGTQAPQ